MAENFYYLQSGDALEIGDEYEIDFEWRVLSENEYAEWVTSVSHYWPEKFPSMSRFRRPPNKDPRLSLRTREIYLKAISG